MTRLTPALAIAMLLFSVPALATSQQLDRVVLGFPVEAIQVESDGTITATVTAHEGTQPFLGAQGQVRAVFQNRPGWTDGAMVLGASEVTSVTNRMVIVRIRPAFVTKPHQISVGDLLEMPVDVPAGHRGILFKMLELGVTFLDSDREQMVVPQALLTDADGSHERTVLDGMAETVRFTEGYMRDVEGMDSLRVPLSAGQYKGATVFEVMAGATAVDVQRFFEFIRSYPGKYMGGTWRLDETFATWVLNQGPYGERQLRDLLMSLDDTAERIRTAREGGQGVTDDHFYRAWAAEAAAWVRAGRREEAERLLDRAIGLASAADYGVGQAIALETLGRIAATAGEIEVALDRFSRALDLFEAAGDAGAVVRLHTLAADALVTADRFAEALERIDAVLDWRRAHAVESPVPDRLIALGDVEQRKARLLRRLGRLAEAKSVFQDAAASFARVATREGNQRHVAVLLDLGSVLADLGDSDAALAEHHRVVALYRDLGDSRGEAEALDQLAARLSALGRNEEALLAFNESARIDLEREDFDQAGYSLSAAGQALWRLGRVDEAMDAHRTAIALRERVGNRSGEAFSWRMLGSLLDEAGRPTDAVEAFTRAAALHEAAGSRSGQAQVAAAMGDLYTRVHDYRNARESLGRAVEAYDALGLVADLARVLLDYGWSCLLVGDLECAQSAFERSLTLRTESGDAEGLVYSTLALARFETTGRHRHDIAQRHFEEALRLARLAAIPHAEAAAVSEMARMLRVLARYAEARQLIAVARTIHESAGDLAAIAQSEYDLADIETVEGDFAAAIQRLQGVVEMAGRAGRLGLAADGSSSLSTLHLLQGDFERAIALQREAMQIHEDAGNPWGIASAHIGLGNIANMRTHYVDAITHYEAADAFYRELEWDALRSGVLNNIGTVHFWQGNHAAAAELFLQSLAILESTGLEDDSHALTLINLGETRLNQQRLDEAAALLARGLAMAERAGSPRIIASALTVSGELALGRGDAAEAIEVLSRAAELAAPLAESYATVRIATLLGRAQTTMGEFQAAADSLDRALAEAERIDSDGLRWQPLYRRALVHSALGEREAAVSLLQRAVATLSALERRLAGGEEARRTFATGRDRLAVYEALGNLLFDLGRFDEAQYWFQRDNDEQLSQQRRGVTYQDAAVQQQLDEAAQIQAARDLARAQVERVRATGADARHEDRIRRLAEVVTIRENEYQSFLGQLSRDHPELTSLVARTLRPEEIAQHMERIPDDMAVLTYWMGADQLFITVLTADGLTGKRIPVSYEHLRQQVEQLYALVQRPDGVERARRGLRRAAVETTGVGSANLDELTLDLYALLIEPVIAEIAGRARLAIVPSGPLSYLPFSMLGKRDGEGAMRYLVEDATVFYLSTLATLSRGPPRADPLRIVAFGNADLTLDSAEVEVRALAERFPDAVVYLRSEATRARVEALPTGYNVLHFATHGVLDFVEPDQTYLALAPSDTVGDDGRFTIADVYSVWGVSGLRGYRLVTLSACNTAMTAPGSEDALVRPAPAYAFLSTGARSAVATMWEVDDEATAQFMESFYDLVGAEGVAAALRAAQTTLRADPRYAHPYYWAPFMVLGHWH